jgi:tetratricopeptide (TPR) repeat protein
MGNCQSFLAQSGDAVASYNAAVALWPKFHWAYFNRGLVHLRQQNFVRAAADLDQAVRLRPDLSELYLNRAIARQGLKDYPAAVADLTRALDLDPACTRAYFMRARTRGLAGDAAGAKRDLDEGMRHEPTDEHGWVARGLARVPTDLPGALEDFDKALEFNPRSLAALQNKGSVLGRSGRAEDAARVLDRAVALYPDFVPSRAGRGVYLARQGKRAAALEDARESLRRDTSPSNLYQVAGIYALTSHEQPDDRLEAFRLLSLALRQGFGFDLLETDRDLGPVRDQPEFKRLVEAARSVRDVAAK